VRRTALQYRISLLRRCWWCDKIHVGGAQRAGFLIETRSKGDDRDRERDMGKTIVAMARKLAIVLHKMWRTGEPFRFGKADANPAAP